MPVFLDVCCLWDHREGIQEVCVSYFTMQGYMCPNGAGRGGHGWGVQGGSSDQLRQEMGMEMVETPLNTQLLLGIRNTQCILIIIIEI